MPFNRHRTAQDMVAEALRRGILSGELRSGQPLRQEQIARDFEVSAVPVREALRQLAGEGLVGRKGGSVGSGGRPYGRKPDGA